MFRVNACNGWLTVAARSRLDSLQLQADAGLLGVNNTTCIYMFHDRFRSSSVVFDTGTYQRWETF